MFHDVFYAFPYASSSPFVVLKRIASGSSSSSPFAVTLLVSNAFVDEVGEKNTEKSGSSEGLDTVTTFQSIKEQSIEREHA